MHDSNKNQDTFDEDLDEFDDEFDDDLDFEEDWDDESDLEEGLIKEQQTPETVTPPTDSKDTASEETAEPPENIDESQASQKFGSKQTSDPDRFPKTKKKRPLMLIIAILVAILAISLTTYNTLRPSLAPTLLPVIKLPGSFVGQNDDSFIGDAQKRIDEIMEKRALESGATEDLMKPFEEEGNIQDNSQKPPQNTADNSVLTPLPTSFESNADELPSLEEALKKVQLNENDSTTMELSGDSGLLDDAPLINPFSDNAPLIDTFDEPLHLGTDQVVNDIRIIDAPEIQDTQAANLEKEKAESEAKTKAAAEETARNVAREAQARAEAKLEAKLEAEKKAKIEAVRKAKQAATATKKKTSVAKTQNTTKASPAPKWEIRGIRPGRAVLYDKVSGDIEAVEPGSKIQGLGRIKEISKKHGRWVVLGSEGNVTQ